MVLILVVPLLVGAAAALLWRLRRARSAEGSEEKAPPVLRSRGGLQVRSRGELLIANYLEARGIPYEYEPRVGGFTPDFLLREKKVIVEYWGLAGRYRRYDRKREEKERRYKQEGYRVIGLTPRHVQRLDQTLGRKLKRHYPDRFEDL